MCEQGMRMVAINEATSSALIFQMRCKRWSCNECAKINSDLWIMRASYGVYTLEQQGWAVDLVTVTAHERHSVKRAVETLPSQWNALRNRWQREVDHPQYLLIPEVGIQGHFHIHILTTASPGTRYWKDRARASGFGYMAKESERYVTSARAGWYVGKYLAKQLNNNIWKRGFHRVRTSQQWPKLPPLDHNSAWRFVPFHLGLHVAGVARNLQVQGYSVGLADDRDSWQFIATGRLTENCQALTMTLPQTSKGEE